MNVNNHANLTEELRVLVQFINSFDNKIVLPELIPTEAITATLIDNELYEEILRICEDTPIFFGDTMHIIKCDIKDVSNRLHEIHLEYKGPKKLIVTSVKLPHSPIMDKEYTSMEEVVVTLKNYINSLEEYFQELQHIDNACTVMEPMNPSFKEDYRKILLDDRTWLHLDVTPRGLASNIHLIGESEHWQQKLQEGLLVWDHDKDIVENIMNVFDITEFPVASKISNEVDDNLSTEAITCSICLCTELPDCGVPQPICQNKLCGVYYHRSCLFQWLIACDGGRPPTFGVVTGSCPSCFQPITCSEKDK